MEKEREGRERRFHTTRAGRSLLRFQRERRRLRSYARRRLVFHAPCQKRSIIANNYDLLDHLQWAMGSNVGFVQSSLISTSAFYTVISEDRWLEDTATSQLSSLTLAIHRGCFLTSSAEADWHRSGVRPDAKSGSFYPYPPCTAHALLRRWWVVPSWMVFPFAPRRWWP